MAKSSSVYVCQQCGYQSPSFLGRCPECGTWNSLVEQIEESRASKKSIKTINPAKIVQISDIEKEYTDRLSSNIKEFDRVLGGGIVRGSVVLVSGDPGIGKSTLLTQLALSVHQDIRLDPESSASPGMVGALYVAGEESPQQIKMRVERIQKGSNLAILSETDIDQIYQTISLHKPTLVIIDSIQTLQTEELESIAGSVSQVRESAHRLQHLAKSLHIPIFLVGHVTKEGTIAGPKTLEHLVDVVLSLEGDPTSNFRVLRASKNRFGPTDEVGIFDITESGMTEVKNPSKIFLDNKVNAPGSAVTAILTGLRPMLLEVQALVTKTNLAIPRRVGIGIDSNRLQLLTAVLSKRVGLPLFDQDVFVNVTGGIRINEPSADLAICMAIVSSLKDKVIKPKSVIIGEVGLLGELRPTRQLEKRISEAKKLGFTNIISSNSTKNILGAIKLAMD